ncbi:MAG: glutamate racemase [Clostridia bacterium]|nr:glutamate racemase [Clostridia bacterium]
MDNRAIGVFDSGMGGLTAMRQLRRLLPDEELIYFGDTGRVPYGGRSQAIIRRYARQDVAFLRQFDLKAILIACGTVTTNALSLLEAENDLPILGVVEPAAAEAARLSPGGRIGVVGTRATVRSGAYEAAIRRLRPDAKLLARACPLLVPLAEEGRVSKEDPIVREAVRAYFAPFAAEGVDTLVLGCTHYPLLAEAIGAFLGPGVTLIDTGAASARALAALLEARAALHAPGGGRQSYYASDSAEEFAALAALFLGADISASVQQVEIERY